MGWRWEVRLAVAKGAQLPGAGGVVAGKVQVPPKHTNMERLRDTGGIWRSTSSNILTCRNLHDVYCCLSCLM